MGKIFEEIVIQHGHRKRITPVQHLYEEDSDAVLVVAVGRGQQRALAEIYHRHGGQAFRLAERLLVDTKRAEDVVQDVFLQLWRDPESFDAERASLRTWLLLKTHGKAVDHIRAEAARRSREERLLNDRTNNETDLDREIWDLTVADRVQQAVGELPEGERQAINLAYFGGHTYTEVAAALGEPEGTVKSRIRKGLTTLRRSLGDLRFDGEHTNPLDRSLDAANRQQLRDCTTSSGRNPMNGQETQHTQTHQTSGTPGTSRQGEKQS
jgi:RNA polymerase sigma-70 factor, ECF subfamily